MAGLVSIITPAYNASKYIADSIQSVQNQSYVNWELIIVDDASTDDTVSIIQEFVIKDTRISLFQLERNSGTAVARNYATDRARGDYIAFLDADDLWCSHKLETQIRLLNDHDCDVCFSSYDLIDEKGNKLNKTVHAFVRLSYKKLLKSNYIGNLTGVYKVSAVGTIKTPELRKRQDWLLWLKALELSGKPAIGIQESLAYYRVHGRSISSNKLQLIKYNYLVYRKGLGFSSWKSFVYLVQFLIEHFFVKSQQIKTEGKT